MTMPSEEAMDRRVYTIKSGRDLDTSIALLLGFEETQIFARNYNWSYFVVRRRADRRLVGYRRPPPYSTDKEWAKIAVREYLGGDAYCGRMEGKLVAHFSNYGYDIKARARTEALALCTVVIVAAYQRAKLWGEENCFAGYKGHVEWMIRARKVSLGSRNNFRTFSDFEPSDPIDPNATGIPPQADDTIDAHDIDALLNGQPLEDTRTDDEKAAALKRRASEEISLGPQPDEIHDYPGCGSEGRAHNWRNYVPEEVQAVWGDLGELGRLAVYLVAVDVANSEDWDR